MQSFTCAIIVNFFILTLTSTAAYAQTESETDSTDFAQISFIVTNFDFGELLQGDKTEHIFTFRNAGNSPLILNNVLSTCGCTVPEWSKEPIPYDSIGTIKVVFDTSLKIGRQNKVVTVRSNSKQGDFRLRISGMVLPPKKNK